MKTIISALMAGALLGSLALADEIDDQIQKLEKENKLLELQKKKKELEMQNQMINKNDTPSNNNLTSNDKTKKTKNPNSKSGGFIGIEGVLGGGDVNFSVNDVINYKNAPTDISYPIVAFSSNTTFDLGLVGGYQHYFGSSQRHGIKVSAHFYSGFGNSYKMNYDEIPFITTDSKNNVQKDFTNDKVSINYTPIKFGFDVKYLYDFLQRGKHTLGLNVGLGYEFDAYVNGKESVAQTTDSSFTNVGTSTISEYHNEYQQDYKLDNIYSNGIYPVIGLHYYYGHHQFELMYRFGGIVDQIASKDVAHEHIDLEGETAKDTGASAIDESIAHKITLNTKSYLTINYAYRF